MSARDGPLEVLVVGWFPAADDTSAGRFIADQVAALDASGAVNPSVVSFENAAVRGRASFRDRQAEAVAANGRAALARRSPFRSAGAAGPPGVPVARLAVAGGEHPAAGADHRAIHRSAALLPLLDRADGRSWDLVHGHVGYPEGVSAGEAATRLRVPLVLTEHASYLASLLADPVVRERYRQAALRAARVIAVSRTLRDELVGIVPELDGRIVVIPNAVAVDEFGVPPDGTRRGGELLWVGHRSMAKGTGTLLHAIAIVRRTRPDVVLRLIGRSADADQEAGWHRLAAELGVADAVRFEGPADRAGVAAAMQRADLFVHPSMRETFGVVAVEALASGLPVVATDSGGVGEVLGAEPDRSGALVPVADPDALAGAIVSALERRAAFDPARLRAAVAERYGADRVARRIIDLYAEVLAEWPGAAGGGHTKPTAPPDVRHPAIDTSRPRMIVVGFSRPQLDRVLARFPARALADSAIVTSGAPIPDRPTVRLAPAGSEGRIADALEWGRSRTGPADRLGRRLRRLGGSLTGLVAAPEPVPGRLLVELGETLEAALTAVPGADRPTLVCLTGLDHLVAAPFIAAGRADAAPGGPRWLADATAEDQPAAAGPGSSDA